MRIVLASRNKKKIVEMQTLLSTLCKKDITVLSLDDIGFFDEIVEDGKSFEENALIKAKAPKSHLYPVIADDSGLCVDALGGEPGIYSARYSGEGATDKSNNEKLLLNLSAIESDKRTARFVSSIACVFPDGSEPIVVTDACEGIILDEYRGNDGFGYDPLFFVPSLNKTFAELAPEVKNEISHRGKAMRKFALEFSKIYKNEN